MNRKKKLERRGQIEAELKLRERIQRGEGWPLGMGLANRAYSPQQQPGVLDKRGHWSRWVTLEQSPRMLEPSE